MGRITRVLGATALTTAATVAVGAVGTELARAWFTLPSLESWQVIAALWLAAPGRLWMKWGLESMAIAHGSKAPIEVRAAGVRGIPVAGVLADAASSLGIWGARQQPRPATTILHVAEQFTIRQGGVIVSEKEATRFLIDSYNRQRLGKHPFSRTYWVEGNPKRIERDHYEAIIATLKAFEQIEGRKGQGSAGRMVYTPGMTLRNLQHALGSPTWDGWPDLV